MVGFRKVPGWIFYRKPGFDGWGEAAWELELGRCDTDLDAEAYALERIAAAKHGGRELEIFSVETHLQGQALGDNPSARTLQFVGGEAVEAYKEWRRSGHSPPRDDPYYVPEEVGKLIHMQAETDLIRSIRLAHFLGKHQNRVVTVPTFTGSPGNCWSSFFLFPPLPGDIGGYDLPDIRQLSMELLVERFQKVFDAARLYETKIGLEAHPSERAMGDIRSARELLDFVIKAGYGDVFGYNYDPSHMVWQNVDYVQFIREFADFIWSVHLKGVSVAKGFTPNGLLGGHADMGDPGNSWNFVTSGSRRDACNAEEVIVALNQAGYSGALNIEWEDNDEEQLEGAGKALGNLRDADLTPSAQKHDETLVV